VWRFCCQSVYSHRCGVLLLNIARSERAGGENPLEHMFDLRANAPLAPMHRGRTPLEYAPE
jgi:hypothetical protein